MGDNIYIETNAGAVLRKFGRLPKEIQTGVRKGLVRGLLLVEERVKRRSDVKFTGGRGGLASRLTSYAKIGPGAIAIDGVIGFRKTQGFPYELAQEYGAKAKPGKAMAVPVTPEARKAGSPRDFPGKLRMIKGMGKALLVSDTDAATHLQYVLLKSIPPRLNFREGVIGGLPIVYHQVLRGMDEEAA